MLHRAVASDVTLQMLLSNHVLFSAAWWVATVVSTFVKTIGAYEDFDVIRPLMLDVWTVFEPCRLYIGYAGNLRVACRRVLRGHEWREEGAAGTEPRVLRGRAVVTVGGRAGNANRLHAR